MDTTKHVLNKLRLYLIEESKAAKISKVIRSCYLVTSVLMILFTIIYSLCYWWHIERQPATLALFILNILLCIVAGIVGLISDSRKFMTVDLVFSILTFFSSFAVTSLMFKDECWDGRYNSMLLAVMITVGIIMNLNSVTHILYSCDNFEWSSKSYWIIQITCSCLACVLCVVVLIFGMYWNIFNLLWIGFVIYGISGIKKKVQSEKLKQQSLIVSLCAMIMFLIEANSSITVYGHWLCNFPSSATVIHAFLSIIPLCLLTMEIACYAYKTYKMSWKKHIFDTNVLRFVANDIFQKAAKGTEDFTKIIKIIGLWQLVISVIAAIAAYFRYWGQGIVYVFVFMVINAVVRIFAGKRRWLILIVAEILLSTLTIIAAVSVVYSECSRLHFYPSIRRTTFYVIMVLTSLITIPLSIFNMVLCAASLHSPMTEEIKSLSFSHEQNLNDYHQPFNLPQVVDQKGSVVDTSKSTKAIKDPSLESFFTPLLSNKEYPVKENDVQEWEV